MASNQPVSPIWHACISCIAVCGWAVVQNSLEIYELHLSNSLAPLVRHKTSTVESSWRSQRCFQMFVSPDYLLNNILSLYQNKFCSSERVCTRKQFQFLALTAVSICDVSSLKDVEDHSVLQILQCFVKAVANSTTYCSKLSWVCASSTFCLSSVTFAVGAQSGAPYRIGNFADFWHQ